MIGLFSEELLEDVRHLRGAEYSFLKQISTPEGAALRARAEAVAVAGGDPVVHRWRELLGSLDNRRFFQGMAEVWVAEHLLAAGWSLPDLRWPGPMLAMTTPEGQPVSVMTLAFVRQVRPRPDTATLQRLVRALNRVDARARIGIHVRRWVPHNFDPEPVRRAVEMWLRDVERHSDSETSSNTDRYAVFTDDHVSLEFALTGERAAVEQQPVAFLLGPYSGQQTLERVESSLLRELEALRQRDPDEHPTLVACVAEQPWRMSRGWLRELLYGKPTWQQVSDAGGFEAAYTASFEPSLLRDRLCRAVSGLLLLDRSAELSLDSRARAYLNPWATWTLSPAALPTLPCFAPRRQEGRHLVLGWTQPLPH